MQRLALENEPIAATDLLYPFTKDRNFNLGETGLNPGLRGDNLPLYHVSNPILYV